MTAPREWLTTREVALSLGVVPSTLRRWVQQGTFPKPSRMNQRVHRWERRVIEEWFDRRQPPN